MPFKPGYDPNRYTPRTSRNPSTAGAEIVRMDAGQIGQYERVKNPTSSLFGGTGSWGGVQGDTWGTFKSVSPAGRDEWTKSPQVRLKADDPW